MPFKTDAKASMFIKSARICCLCLKQCGTNIEAAHIVDESKGGSNDESNGIPLCFDCHQEIGGYDPKHPKGNKFSHDELRARRDRVYRLVESGAMYANVIAAAVRAHGGTDVPQDRLKPPTPSSEARELLERILAGDTDACRGGKLKMLDPESRGVILDHLVQNSEKRAVTESLMQITASPLLNEDEKRVIVDRTTRRVTMFGNAYAKAALLKSIPPALFLGVAADIRAAFFEDVIECIESDQFDPVNELVPPLANHLSAVPSELHSRFVHSLLGQARSSSYEGAPAAQRMLTHLPPQMAAAGVNAINVQFLLWYGHRDEVKAFVAQAAAHVGPDLMPIITDYQSMKRRAFSEKYGGD
jgi:hypothetical protein